MYIDLKTKTEEECYFEG